MSGFLVDGYDVLLGFSLFCFLVIFLGCFLCFLILGFDFFFLLFFVLGFGEVDSNFFLVFFFLVMVCLLLGVFFVEMLFYSSKKFSDLLCLFFWFFLLMWLNIFCKILYGKGFTSIFVNNMNFSYSKYCLVVLINMERFFGWLNIWFLLYLLGFKLNMFLGLIRCCSMLGIYSM